MKRWRLGFYRFHSQLGCSLTLKGDSLNIHVIFDQLGVMEKVLMDFKLPKKVSTEKTQAPNQ